MPNSKLRPPIAGCPVANWGLYSPQMETVGPAIGGRSFEVTINTKGIRQSKVYI